MGRDKALLEIERETLVRRSARLLESLFEKVIVVTNRADVAKAAQLASVADSHESKGPLAGIEAALDCLQAPAFIVACDLPFLNAGLIRHQCQAWRPELDVLVAQSEDGIEPLHAVWSPSSLEVVSSYLQAERPPSLRRVLGDLNTATVSIQEARRFDAELRCFHNWNTPDDVKL